MTRIRSAAVGGFQGVRAVAREGSKVELVAFITIKQATELCLGLFQVHNIAQVLSDKPHDYSK